MSTKAGIMRLVCGLSLCWDVWDFSSIVWTYPDSRQRNLLLGQKIDFDIAVAGGARPVVGASLTPRAIWRVVGLQYWGVYNPVPLFQHLCHIG